MEHVSLEVEIAEETQHEEVLWHQQVAREPGIRTVWHEENFSVDNNEHYELNL